MNAFDQAYMQIIMEEESLIGTNEPNKNERISETFFAAAAEVNGKLKFLVTSNARWMA